MTTVRRTGIPGVVVIESPGQPGATGSVKVAVSVRAIASIQPDFGVIAAVRVKLTTGDSFYANGDIETFLAALAVALDPETHSCS